MTACEKYNGLGYAARGIPSPYVWSGTDQYRSGKYVRDGVFDPSVVDRQLGCAGLLLAMMQLDPSIGFGAKPAATIVPAAPHPPPPDIPKPRRRRSAPAQSAGPSITHPARGSIGAAIASLLAAIFNRKG